MGSNNIAVLENKEAVMSRYIDADALHDALKAKQKWVVRCGDKHNEGYTYDQVHFAIDDAPSIDIEPKHGKWIRDRYWSRGIGMGEEYGFSYKCSLCEYEVENGYTRCGFNFCPNCGADMREVRDE